MKMLVDYFFSVCYIVSIILITKIEKLNCPPN